MPQEINQHVAMIAPSTLVHRCSGPHGTWVEGHRSGYAPALEGAEGLGVRAE